MLVENIDDAAHLIAVMANGNRLKILCILLDNEVSVNSIAEMIDIQQSAVSQHLMILRKLELISKRREGQHVYYRVSSPDVEMMLSAISSICIGSPMGPNESGRSDRHVSHEFDRLNGVCRLGSVLRQASPLLALVARLTRSRYISVRSSRR
ncbi:metalloregulator ArsR/SmtB family transcription factor [Brucella sp. NM4]|uniref:ArsR/SmtB family transcription factor n=1 Tax=Ochrobactrum sp. SSR TaxID=3045176 RepID=UPI0024BD1221|nr:metalloregulator ArsR/SmtB family transcription factor [Brucella sp. NM4]WHS30641.1 metalloregulator ArsR/SmtB family transcription factor [Brucella sp. NM4]WHT44270.1 metalloregulator ArsR/SmtB family transcription factor [Ochrobactrum sp. SSR]